MNRVQYFQMLSYNATYGYVYRPQPRITHELTPVNVQYVHLISKTADFDTLLRERPYLNRTFQDQFILGSIYNFTYNTQTQPTQRNHFFFNGNVDVSGNVLNLLQTQVFKSEDDPRTIAKQPYAQYARLDFDTRYYRGITRRSQLATRMLIGIGMPYGNSKNLPYVKQFSIGGPNSIRSFRPRELGPGTYTDTTTSGFFDQTGDIRFETNVEYRFDIVPYLKGAVFVDAGNIWLARKDPDLPGETQRTGGEFIFSKALSQLAVGTGVGLRIDAEFFVLRFDLGIPVRDPAILNPDEPTNPYVLKIPPERKNMVFHIAVGYPF
jgi:hemolysin activation/secretion protein